jgi:CHASE2 domain-containing sensor protein
VTLAATLTSIAWFPAPTTPDAEILRYLEVERRWLASGPHLAAMAFLVGGSLWLLATAFWTRRWLYGLLVLNAATLLKVVFGVAFGGEAGWVSLAPSLVTLAICNAAFAALYVRHRRKEGWSSRER